VAVVLNLIQTPGATKTQDQVLVFGTFGSLVLSFDVIAITIDHRFFPLAINNLIVPNAKAQDWVLAYPGQSRVLAFTNTSHTE